MNKIYSMIIVLCMMFVQSAYGMRRAVQVSVALGHSLRHQVLHAALQRTIPRALGAMPRAFSSDDKPEVCKHCGDMLVPVVLENGAVEKRPVVLRKVEETKDEYFPRNPKYRGPFAVVATTIAAVGGLGIGMKISGALSDQ